MLRYMIMILAAALLLGGCGEAEETEETEVVTALTVPEYPPQAPYPDESEFMDAKGNFDGEGFSAAFDAWQEEQSRRGSADTTALNDFTRRAAPVFLQGEGNRLCSPLNLYLALGMLSEVTDGESRAQILDLLAQPGMTALRQNAGELWAAHYRDDGAAASKLASSLWLRPDITYNTETLERLRDIYYASAYQGVMGSEATDAALQNWINENTGNLLRQQAEGLQLDENTILALATTIYYNARWFNTFAPEVTQEAVFHAADGDVTCQLMKRSSSMTYCWGERFGAVTLGLEEGRMELILPDDGVTPAMLLEDAEFWDYALGSGDWAQQKYLVVHLGLPRFDVSGDLELGKSLRALGVRDVFDASRADFSPLGASEAVLSQVRHAARVKANEDGVEAAAYTMMAVAGAAMPPEEEMDFLLDRPFVFLLRGDDGAPLFLGVVETTA